MGGDGWGVTGAGWNINPTHDMSYEWMKDTLQFKYKTAKFSGDNIRLQYEAGSGKLVKVVDITADDKWHTVKVALQDFVYGDGTTSGFDTTQVGVFQFIAQGKGYQGETMMITEAWTGNPSFDFVSPAVAENVDAIPGNYTNAVVWDDVVANLVKYMTFMHQASHLHQIVQIQWMVQTLLRWVSRRCARGIPRYYSTVSRSFCKLVLCGCCNRCRWQQEQGGRYDFIC